MFRVESSGNVSGADGEGDGGNGGEEQQKNENCSRSNPENRQTTDCREYTEFQTQRIEGNVNQRERDCVCVSVLAKILEKSYRIPTIFLFCSMLCCFSYSLPDLHFSIPRFAFFSCVGCISFYILTESSNIFLLHKYIRPVFCTHSHKIVRSFVRVDKISINLFKVRFFSLSLSFTSFRVYFSSSTNAFSVCEYLFNSDSSAKPFFVSAVAKHAHTQKKNGPTQIESQNINVRNK